MYIYIFTYCGLVTLYEITKPLPMISCREWDQPQETNLNMVFENMVMNLCTYLRLKWYQNWFTFWTCSLYQELLDLTIISQVSQIDSLVLIAFLVIFPQQSMLISLPNLGLSLTNLYYLPYKFHQRLNSELIDIERYGSPDSIISMETLFAYCPSVRGIHQSLMDPLHKGPVVCICGQLQQDVSQTIKLPVVWDTTNFMWCHCNAKNWLKCRRISSTRWFYNCVFMIFFFL